MGHPFGLTGACGLRGSPHQRGADEATGTNEGWPSVSIIAQFTVAPPGLRHQSSLLRDPVRLYRLGFCFRTEKDPKCFCTSILFASVHPASFPPQGTNSQAAVAPSKRSNFPSLRRNGIVSPLLAKHHAPTPAASHRPAPNIVRPSVRNHAVSLRPPTIQRALT